MHIVCLSHRLNLQVNQMVREDTLFAYCFKRVEESMQDFKSKLTSRATLRNITSLSPILYNKMRWSESI